MATKKKRTPVKGPIPKAPKGASGKAKGKVSPKQLLVDIRADLTQAITGDKKSGVEVMAFSDDGVIGHVTRYLSTGCLAIDRMLGTPGLPFGRLVEFYGTEDSGKSTCVLQCIRSVQKMKGVAAVVDTENKLPEDYARKLGVKTDEVLLIQPRRKTFESVVRAIIAALDNWVEKGRQDVPLSIFWDSIAGTPTESELNEFGTADEDDEKPGKVKPGEAGKLLSAAMRVLIDKLARANALLVVVNQLYSTFARFGKKKTTYGGKAIRYHATMRLEFTRTGWLKNSAGLVLGVEGKCHAYKNNIGAPSQPCEYGITYGIGFDNYVTLYNRLKSARYITTGGGWNTLGIDGRPPQKFQSTFVGLAGLCQQDPTLRPLLEEIYKAL